MNAMVARKPLRIEYAYPDLSRVWRLVVVNAPYRSMAGLEGYREYGMLSAMPWFREHWALDGRALVPGVDAILHNSAFIEGARKVFGGGIVRPMTLLINLMGPMPAGTPHIDTPSFRGAERTNFPLWMLLVMGASGLFRHWSLAMAGTVSWFYDGEGGEFEYWPDGHDGPAVRETSPFGNAAVVTDSDRMYHRVGAIGRAGSIWPSAILAHRQNCGGRKMALGGSSMAARLAPSTSPARSASRCYGRRSFSRMKPRRSRSKSTPTTLLCKERPASSAPTFATGASALPSRRIPCTTRNGRAH
ncbi:MAG: hypothetical protein ACLQU2_11095 [Candidatus Binataceae bacterium]